MYRNVMKTCFKCGITKPFDQFYAHPQMKDGYLNKCKSCAKIDSANRHHTKKSGDPNWYESELERQRLKSKKMRLDGRHSKPSPESRRGYSQRFPSKRKAVTLVNNSLRDGKIKRLPCEVCGDKKAQAHHDDYSKPLEIRWLCVTHHAEHHRNEKRELRGKGIFKHRTSPP